MVNNLLGEALGQSRTRTYSGILQVDDGADTWQYKMIQGFNVTFNDTELDRDRIDNGAPVFTGTGDVIGSFNLDLKATVDLADANAAPTADQLLSYWAYQLSIRKPAEIDFIQTFNSPDSSGNKFMRARFKGRVMSTSLDRLDEVGVDEAHASGEVIAFTSILRELS